MLAFSSRHFVESLLATADISVNGSRPWDLQVHNDRFFARVLRQGSLGLGEAYLDGWWDAEELDQFFWRLLRAGLDQRVRLRAAQLWLILVGGHFNRQRPARAYDIGRHHYDIGNDLYQAMLDRRLTYTCGYWLSAATLDQAQEAKLELVCRKLGLKPGMQVLDIGCGWGSFAKFAAERYGVSVVGVTVSQAQVELGRKLCAGWPVDIRLQDYREVTGTFDRIVSLGMFEHVGLKNYHVYMQQVQQLLKDDGLWLLHTIGSNRSGTIPDPWVNRYIFPGGMVPSITQIGAAIEGRFVMEDWHNFGADYDKTLMAWFTNFDAHWTGLQEKYGERFYRMWKYYLLSCAGAFRARELQLWQVVLSPRGTPGGYISLR